MSLADTLKEKKGPLPVWAWTGLFVVLLAGFMIYRNKKAAAAAAADSTSGGTGATDLGNTNLSALTPSAFPMPYQGGDVFVNVPNPGQPGTGDGTGTGTGTGTGSGSGGGSGGGNTPPPPSVKYPNQNHKVGVVGQQYPGTLQDLVDRFYPNATPQQKAEIVFATVKDPKNAKYNLGSNHIPGGADIEFYSQAVK